MAGKRTFEVRISAGTLRGRVLRYPDTPTIRPTMQRTRESVFNSLGDAVRGAVFVDLYAAAGAVGIEALSRGAAVVHFVEGDRDALRFLRDNLDRCGLSSDRAHVHGGDVIDYLRRGALADIRPDIVYADPPYRASEAGLFLEFLSSIDYASVGRLVLEHDSKLPTSGLQGWDCVRERVFGQTAVSVFIPGEGGDR